MTTAAITIKGCPTNLASLNKRETRPIFRLLIHKKDQIIIRMIKTQKCN